jgi:HNH endonuclease
MRSRKPCPDCGRPCCDVAKRCRSCATAAINRRRAKTAIEKPTLEQLLRRTVADGDCLLWTGAKDGKGYGNVGRMASGSHKNWIVHRLVYELVHGPIHRRLDVHHICERKDCVNPDHLEALTRIEHQGIGGRHREHTRPAVVARLTKASA